MWSHVGQAWFELLWDPIKEVGMRLTLSLNEVDPII